MVAVVYRDIMVKADAQGRLHVAEGCEKFLSQLSLFLKFFVEPEFPETV